MFTLQWTQHALDDLADVWVAVDPPTRDRIEKAINDLNRDLRDDRAPLASRGTTTAASGSRDRWSLFSALTMTLAQCE